MYKMYFISQQFETWRRCDPSGYIQQIYRTNNLYLSNTFFFKW